MAKSNIDRIGEALDHFVKGFRPFVMDTLAERHGDEAVQKAFDILRSEARAGMKVPNKPSEWDAPALVNIVQTEWQYLFRRKLSQADRSMLFELREVRNRWAHRNAFTLNDTLRSLDTIQRLLESVKAAPEAEKVQKLHGEVMRARFDEMRRAETTRASRVAVDGTPQEGLRPWREVISPHADVLSGNFTNAEFAADLAQVYRKEASTEYGEPGEFFRRTFLTEGLTGLLKNALKRLAGKGGHPVIELRTNFGGGKTHSMLALYHLLSGAKGGELAGVEPLMNELEIDSVPKAARAVLVGTKMSVAQPEEPEKGLKLNTLWGRMAYQLAGRKGYDLIAESDRLRTSPGTDDLVKLFKLTGPCLILIDEWVAFVREAYERSDLPIGSFDTNLTFAQSLTEAVKAVKTALLVASLPQSKIEVGGEGGQAALDSLKDTFGRVEFNWRPANQQESYEIVRRRLFEPIKDTFAARDAVVAAFAELYQSARADYPAESHELTYRNQLQQAYPIHPELFDRLYNDWATLEQFQRTRGVLRLMATVIHTLWVNNDRSLLIMPSMIPLAEPTVQTELTRYVTENWPYIIEQDIDGQGSLPGRIDREAPRFGKLSAVRRVSRAIYMGSAPVPERANKGLDMRQVRLACVQPGENSAVFGDAVRQLADSANYLYADGSRYWFDTQPNVNRVAADRAHQQKEDDVLEEIRRRLRLQQKLKGPFSGVHACPDSAGGVPDDRTARLVILDPLYPHTRNAPDSLAERHAAQILSERSSGPRLYRNALVFLAADRASLENLTEAARTFLAWDSIVSESDSLDLTPLNRNLAVRKRREYDTAVDARLADAYGWLIVPKQPDPRGAIEYEFIRQGAQTESFAERAGQRLERDGTLTGNYGFLLLRQNLDKILWQDKDHVRVRDLVDYYAQYLYLERLTEPDVLLKTIRDGVATLTWLSDGFAYAEAYDEKTQRYRGLAAGRQDLAPRADDQAVVVRPEVATRQLEREGTESPEPGRPGTGTTTGGAGSPGGGGADPTAPPRPKCRFYAATNLGPDRVARDAAQIAENVVAFLVAADGAEVTVRLEIEATSGAGFDERTIRNVLENCRTLKFGSSEFDA